MRIALAALAAVAALFAIPVGVVVYSEIRGWNWARPWIEREARSATGRELELAGPLDVDLGLHPRIVAREVRFANVEGSEIPRMLDARSIALQVRLFPLFLGRVRLEQLTVEGTRVFLEVDREGRGNWDFGSSRAGIGGGSVKSSVSLPDELLARDSELVFLDRRKNERVEVVLDALAARGGEQLDVGFFARGSYQKQPLWAQGRIGSLEDLRAGEPFPVRAEARLGPTHARVIGLVERPKKFDGVNVQLQLEGGSLAQLWPLLGLPLAETPPYRVVGRLRREGETWSLERFRGRLGKSDLSGTFAVSRREGHRPLLRAAIRSNRLDIDDVEGFYGRPPAEERKSAVRTADGEGRIFSDRTFDFAKLQAMDAAVDFRARRVQGKSMLDDVRLELALVDGQLKLDPLVLGFAGGRLTSHTKIDARGKVAKLRGDVVLSSVDVRRLLQESKIDAEGFGVVGGRADLATYGNSLHEMASHLDGDFGALMQDGELSDELIEIAALDLGEALVRKVKGEHAVPIRCMVGVFDIDDGRMNAEELLLDSKVDRLRGEGYIDLAEERIDLRIFEHPRRFTFGSLSSPIVVDGTLAERKAHLDRKQLFKRGGAAVVLGALIHPAAALLALVELEGKKEPGACREAIEEYRQIAVNEPPAVPARVKASGGSAQRSTPGRSPRR